MIDFNVFSTLILKYYTYISISRVILQKVHQVADHVIQFGMSHTFLTFGNRYFVYAGTVNLVKKGVTIGGFELAWWFFEWGLTPFFIHLNSLDGLI